jgi:hypothetical protein
MDINKQKEHTTEPTSMKIYIFWYISIIILTEIKQSVIKIETIFSLSIKVY